MVKKAKSIDRYSEEDLIETAIDHLHDMGEVGGFFERKILSVMI